MTLKIFLVHRASVVRKKLALKAELGLCQDANKVKESSVLMYQKLNVTCKYTVTWELLHLIAHRLWREKAAHICAR